ncbi:MAG: hypothetical protein LHV68_05075 [Elusimicrobia bacterium]|nr:hypothetical protein [Candidatus Liberimonas magnetica]
MGGKLIMGNCSTCSSPADSYCPECKKAFCYEHERDLLFYAPKKHYVAIRTDAGFTEQQEAVKLHNEHVTIPEMRKLVDKLRLNKLHPETWGNMKKFSSQMYNLGEVTEGWYFCESCYNKIKSCDQGEIGLSGVKKAENVSGCYIASTVYSDSKELYKIEILREFRNNILIKNQIGKVLIKYYNVYGPSIAKISNKYIVINRIFKIIINMMVKMISSVIIKTN